MKRVNYLTPIEALAIHAILLKRYGGSQGKVDMGLLESALYRPQTGYYPDIISQATALFESLIMNHPFTDGNKRVGFAVTDIFLRENGYKFKASPSDIYLEIINRLETNNFKYETLIIWMKNNTAKIN